MSLIGGDNPPGDGGGGGGGGGTPPPAPPAPPSLSGSGARAAGSGAIYDQIAVTSNGTAGTNAPAYPLLPSMKVEVSPIATNAAVAYLARSEPASRTGPRTAFAIGAPPRDVDVRNLAELWVFGAAGEGLLITVRQNAA